MQSCTDVVSLESIGCVKSPSTVGNEMEGTNDSCDEGDLLGLAQGLVMGTLLVGSADASADKDVRWNGVDDDNGGVAVLQWVSVLP